MTFLKVAFAFIAFFRPAIAHPSLPSTFFILPFVLIQLARSKGGLWRPLALLRAGAFALGFVLIWSLSIDILTGKLFVLGFRSQFATAVRFVLYVYIAYAFVFLVCKSREDLDKTILLAVLVQCVIAAFMYADNRFKTFFYSTMSGYTGREKIFRDHFFDVRIFGWPEELFYVAPAMMLSAVIILYRAVFIKWISAVLIVSIVAIFNARISLVALLLLGKDKKGLGLLALILCFVFFGGDVIYSLKQGGAGRIVGILEYILADFEGGGSRTLRILLGHVFFPSSFLGWVFGEGRYFYGGSADVISDIGYIISLMYGGVIYLFFWIFLFVYIIFRASRDFFMFSSLLAIFSILAFKGLIFSGNSMTMLVLVLFFRRLAYAGENA
jgi:hypothetical protein